MWKTCKGVRLLTNKNMLLDFVMFLVFANHCSLTTKDLAIHTPCHSEFFQLAFSSRVFDRPGISQSCLNKHDIRFQGKYLHGKDNKKKHQGYP